MDRKGNKIIFNKKERTFISETIDIDRRKVSLAEAHQIGYHLMNFAAAENKAAEEATFNLRGRVPEENESICFSPAAACAVKIAAEILDVAPLKLPDYPPEEM